MKTFKKLFSVSAIVALLGTLAPMYAFGADYSAELVQAYDYAHGHGITTMSSIDNADMYGNLTRIAMAKMLANYAVDVLGLTPDTTKDCTFPDVSAALDEQYGNGVTKACQLGLMGVGIEKFNPNGLVTRAEFGTAFSRALNGGDAEKLAEMNKADPYYKEHLNFLKEEGIMTKIDTPTQLEVRGYVMLMMMRSDSSYTPTEGCTAEELLKCLTADDYDACIATCSNENNNEEDLVHKSGTLNVSVTGKNGAKAIIDGDSELDTIKLNASEAINVEKVTLERYGYTKNLGVTVWLENTDGVVISNEKALTNAKDEISLTIKKDYRNAVENDEYVIVTSIDAALGNCDVEPDGTLEGSNVTEDVCKATAGYTAGTSTFDVTVTHTAGETIGFKVTDITSSAEKLKIASYTPTEYSLAVNNSSDITVTPKGKTTTYNYTNGESYQVAKLRVTAANADIEVNGFTVEGAAAHDMDMSKYVDKVEVLGDDGKALKLSTSDVKKDSIKVTFPAQAIAAKKNADFTVLVSLKNFDSYGDKIQLNIKNVTATETKTSTRVTSNIGTPAGYPFTYTFQGGKIKVTNKNLGNISAAQSSEDVVIAEGEITLDEAVELNTFTVTADNLGIDTLELWLNGSVVAEATTTNGLAFTFTKPLIEKSGKLQFVADMKDVIAPGTVITITPSVNSTTLTVAGTVGKYDDSGEDIVPANFAGTISFSKINVQTAKGALENTISKKVEVIEDGSAVKKTVFEGTYAANKGDVYLNEFDIAEATPTALIAGENITFYLSINGEEVADVTFGAGDSAIANETFSDVLVKKGEKATVKVEAEIESSRATAQDLVYALTLRGEDKDGVVAGTATENMTTISLVTAGSVTVVASNNDDVVLQGTNVTLAKFTVKSSIAGTKLTALKISGLKQGVGGATLTAANIKVKVNGEELTMGNTDDYTISAAGVLTTVANAISEEIEGDGIIVEVMYKGLISPDEYAVTLDTVNTTTVNKTFNKNVVPALVKVTKQENLGDTTQYTFSVEKYDESYDVVGLVLTDAIGTAYPIAGSISDGYTDELNNDTISAYFIDTVDYNVVISGTPTPVPTIKKAVYKDYFKVGNSFLKIFKAKDN